MPLMRAAEFCGDEGVRIAKSNPLSAQAEMRRDLQSQRDGRTEILSVKILVIDVRAADQKSSDQRHDFHAANIGRSNLRLFESIARIWDIDSDVNLPREALPTGASIGLLAYDRRLAIVALPCILFFGAGAVVCVWMIHRSRKSSLTCR
jgi:hypothetical protein